MLQLSITKISLKIIYQEFLWNLPDANELNNYINPLYAELFWGNVKKSLHLLSFLDNGMGHRFYWPFSVNKSYYYYYWRQKFSKIFHTLYQGCWWPSDTRSQSISSHGIDLVFFPEYSRLSTTRVNQHLACQDVNLMKHKFIFTF